MSPHFMLFKLDREDLLPPNLDKLNKQQIHIKKREGKVGLIRGYFTMKILSYLFGIHWARALEMLKRAVQTEC